VALSMWQRKAHLGHDRRNDSRVPCTGETLIDVLDPSSQTSLPAGIIDVGTSSLKVALARASALFFDVALNNLSCR
jgi:hypothetical protein